MRVSAEADRVVTMDRLEKFYDAVVIGSGAAGSIAVKELTERGLEVLLLEAGRDLSEEDFIPSRKPGIPRQGIGLMARIRGAARGQHVQARRAFYAPQFNRFLVNDRDNPYSTPPGERFLWIRGRILGGRLHSFGRVLMRMSDYDFGGASHDGCGQDWPISYDDLAPYYDRVETLADLSGNPDGSETIPDGNYAHPAKLSSAEEEFKRQVEGRWPERRVISWRFTRAKAERVPPGIVAARQTGRLTTRTDAVVRRITIDERTGRADGAVFIDRITRAEHQVSARMVVLCASTIESVRLLLGSESRAHPNGIGNSAGLLGRYFMDQCPSLTFGWVPGFTGHELDDSAPTDPFYAPPGGIFVPRYLNLDAPGSEFARGFSFQGAIGRFPAGEEAAGFGVMGYGEMLPNFDNRITLDRGRQDAWGLPVPHIRCAMSENERKLLRQQILTVREMVESCGYRVNFSGSALGLDSPDVWPEANPISRLLFRREFPRSLALGAAIHECGGARMGSDPATSVVNEFNQVWGVPNLLVTDGSSFVSSGTVGPALTIMALTARACEHAVSEFDDLALTRSSGNT